MIANRNIDLGALAMSVIGGVSSRLPREHFVNTNLVLVR